MERQLDDLLDGFVEIQGVDLNRDDLQFDFSAAPHQRPSPLRDGQFAVYLFFQGNNWLRIGKTNYSTRFTSQHYGTTRAKSCFARDLWRAREHYGYEGDEDRIDNWIFQNFGRANIRFPAQAQRFLPELLETFLHFHLDPEFEGAR